MTFESYDEFEKSIGISAISPGATYARQAWNAAVNRMIALHKAGPQAENNDYFRAWILLDQELQFLITEDV
jgi:hypothetical protein